MKTVVAIILTGTLVLCGSSAHALLYHADFPLSGGQEVPPVVTDGSGLGAVDYDDTTNTLSWSITHSTLSGTPTAAHFHASAPAGSNAGVELVLDHTVNPMVGLAVLSDTQEGGLFSGLWYVNIHTPRFPAGEIRGQVVGFALVGDAPVPEPTGLGLLGLGLLALRRRRR